MGFSFANPVYLWLLLALPVVALLSFRSLAGLGGFRRALALGMRLVIFALLILSLAETQRMKEGQDLSVFFLLDVSESIERPLKNRSLQWLNQATEDMGPKEKAALIVFGREARFETPIERSLNVPRIESELSGSHTDVGSALRLALAAFPEGDQRRIVLISDGNENKGRAKDEIQAAAAQGIPVDVVPLEYEHEDEVLVQKVILPEEVRTGETFEVKIVVEAFQDGPAVLRLYEQQDLVSSEEVMLEKGKNVFTVPRVIQRKGFFTYEAVVETDQDSLYQNNRGHGFTMVSGESMVLYLEPTAGENPFLVDALEEERIKVDVRGVDQIPLGLADYQPFDLIIIDNVPAGAFTERQMLTMESAVKDLGIGLMMVGGENSFGAGGYRGSPIERVLPVDMEIKQRKVMPNGALVLVMHTCEFPNGNMWGKRISEKAISTLSAQDQAGLLIYDSQGQERWLFPIAPVGDGSAMKALIRTMQAGDMPDFDKTLRMAHQGLLGTRAALKHVIIISDGDPVPPNMNQIAKMANIDKITISTIQIGGHGAGGRWGGSASTMKNVAQVGKGRYYEVQNPEELPQIFVKEASVVRKSLIYERTFTPQMASITEIVRGFEGQALPQLHGYVATSPKDLAEVPIIALMDKTKDPILAHWRYGLGKSVAFTSDAKNRWAAQWLPWENHSKFWAQVVRWASRTGGRGEFQASVRIDGEDARLSLDAVDLDGQFVNFLEFEGRVSSPSLEGEDLTVTQTAPGRYETDFKTDEVGTYFLNLVYEDEDGAKGFFTTGIPVSYSPEYLRLKTNETFLQTVRETTGGRDLSIQDPRGVFSREGLKAQRSHRDIWPSLLLAAMILFVGDVFIRRVWVPWEKFYAFIARMYARIARRRKKVEIASPVQRLLKAKPELKGRGLPLKRFQAGEAPSPPKGEEVKAPGVEAKVEKKPEAVIRKKTPQPKKPEAPSNYTGRLLDAKRRAFKRKQ